MKNTIKKTISMAAFFCLLAASLTGCGNKTVTEIAQTDALSQQEIPNRVIEAPEMTPDQVEVPEEDVQELIQAGLNAVIEESDLWSISEVTDTEVLMQLMQGHGGRERPEGENFDGEHPENMTPPYGERTEGEIPEGTKPEWDEGNLPENMDGAFPEGEKPEGGQGRGEDGRQPGNRGGGMAGVALVVTSTEDAVLSKEDILSQIQLAAEELGLKASSMELTEEQEITIGIPDGHAIKLVVFVNTQMPKMETGEAVG
ncbi:MAG: hypothetical protein J6J12_03630 [Oscillospiraceae bacterium]|nr:hypothetical protein [Oscillospiraceae bacterium]